MKVICLRIIVASLCVGFACAHAQTAPSATNLPPIATGLTKKEVIDKMGEPQGALKDGDTELFVYKGIDVRFRNGLVINVKCLNADLPDAKAGWKQRLLDSEPVAKPTQTNQPAPTASKPVPVQPAPVQSETNKVASVEPTPVVSTNLATAEELTPARKTASATPLSRFAQSRSHPLTLASRVMLWSGIAVGSIGLLGAVASGIWFLVKAFQVHIGWGLACIFLPFANLVFLVMHWDISRKPFLANIGAACLAGGGFYLAFFSLAH